MFIQNAFLLFTAVVKDKHFCESDGIFEALSTRRKHRSLVLKDSKGCNVTEISTNKNGVHLILAFSQEIFGRKTRHAYRVDDVIAERIVTYMRDYYEKRHTNCSTFVEFVRTGKFRECDIERSSFMFFGGMNSYTGQKIRPGDSVCVLYYNRLGGRREILTEIRKRWQEASKNVTGDLERLKSERNRSWSPEQMFNLYRDYSILYTDYHFMICVGVYEGEPIFMQQLGRNDPAGENRRAPIVSSIGMTDVMGYRRPAFMFIKRGRM